MGYTSRPAHTTEDVQKYADIPGRLAYYFTSDYCKRFCIELYIAMWHLAGFGCPFGPAIAQALRVSVLYFRSFHASSEDDNSSPVQLSLVNATFFHMCPALNENENDNEAIRIS